MPLISNNSAQENKILVEIDGDHYWLKKQINWWESAQGNVQTGIVFHIPGSRIKNNQPLFDNDDMVPMTMESGGEAQLKKMQIRIVSWSHEVPISEKTLKRLPPSHADLIMRTIRELEKTQKEAELSDDSPLDES